MSTVRAADFPVGSEIALGAVIITRQSEWGGRPPWRSRNWLFYDHEEVDAAFASGDAKVLRVGDGTGTGAAT